jgi:excisionase family DNA binding protein
VAQPTVASEIISVTELEQTILKQVEHIIVPGGGDSVPPKFIGSDGRAVDLPASLVQLLHTAVHHLAQGQAVMLVPTHQDLTTQQAADLLNLSRPYLVKLLEQGDIPHTKTGTHRRVRLPDVMSYKARRDAHRSETLTQLTQLSQDMGLYDE